MQPFNQSSNDRHQYVSIFIKNPSKITSYVFMCTHKIISRVYTQTWAYLQIYTYLEVVYGISSSIPLLAIVRKLSQTFAQIYTLNRIQISFLIALPTIRKRCEFWPNSDGFETLILFHLPIFDQQGKKTCFHRILFGELFTTCSNTFFYQVDSHFPQICSYYVHHKLDIRHL